MGNHFPVNYIRLENVSKISERNDNHVRLSQIFENVFPDISVPFVFAPEFSVEWWKPKSFRIFWKLSGKFPNYSLRIKPFVPVLKQFQELLLEWTCNALRYDVIANMDLYLHLRFLNFFGE